MAAVRIPDALARFTAGETSLELAVDSYRHLLRTLEASYPGLGPELEKLAVAIDGTIYQQPLLESIEASSEVFFLPRIEGG